MNKYRIERIEMIVAMIMTITGLPENVILNLIKNTTTYRNIIEGDECTLYEDYSANVIDIAREIKVHDIAQKVTPDAVSNLNQWMFENDIENARQLKEKSRMRVRRGHTIGVTISNNNKNIIAVSKKLSEINRKKRKQLKLFELKRNAVAKSIHSKRVDGLTISESLRNKKESINKVKKGKRV